MAKYSYEFKKKIVEEYKNGEGGYAYLSKKYNIPDKKTLRTWVNAYNAFGSDGLLRSRKNKTYSFEFKLNVVELYLTTEVSYQELALRWIIGTKLSLHDFNLISCLLDRYQFKQEMAHCLFEIKHFY